MLSGQQPKLIWCRQPETTINVNWDNSGLYLLEVRCGVIWDHQKYSACPSVPFYYSLMLPALQQRKFKLAAACVHSTHGDD